MKIALLFSLLFASLAFGQKKPEAIPDSRKEAISQMMLQVQQAQINLQAAQMKFKEMQDKFVSMEESLRKEFHAEACNLATDKTWVCPPQEKGAVPTK